MAVGHLDASSGASGDMFLGAVLGAGASIEAVQAAVDTLGVGNVRITIGRVKRGGQSATLARVRPPEETPPVRKWPQVHAILTHAVLDDPVRDRALATFLRLAEAEAEVHDVPLDEVHFHELGALDTLADIVGTCAGLHDLGIDELTVGPIGVGTGSVETAHGRLALPVPATSHLLRGFDLMGTRVPAELVTPTGAALIAEFCVPSPAPPMRLGRVGVGAGSRDNSGRANVLRLLIGAEGATDEGNAVIHLLDAAVPRELGPEWHPVDGPRREPSPAEPEDVADRLLGLAPIAEAEDLRRNTEALADDVDLTVMWQVEATVDDLHPEFLPTVLDGLREVGAADAWATPTLMKKGRAGHTIVALCGETVLRAVRERLVRDSTTIGLRWWRVHREALAREILSVTVDGAPIRVKVARLADEVVTVAPEADDVVNLSRTTGRAPRDIRADAVTAARRALNG